MEAMEEKINEQKGRKRISVFGIIGIVLGVIIIAVVAVGYFGVMRLYGRITKNAAVVIDRESAIGTVYDMEAYSNMTSTRSGGGALINFSFSIESVLGGNVLRTGNKAADCYTLNVDPTLRDHNRLHINSVPVAISGLNEHGHSVVVTGIDGVESDILSVAKYDTDIVNTLIVGIGIDSESDYISLFSHNKSTGAVKIVCFNELIAVHVNGAGNVRLKAIAREYGIGALVNAINSSFGLDISDYVTIDRNGATNIANKLGGVRLALTQEEYDYLASCNMTPTYVQNTENTYLLNGEQLSTYYTYIENGNFSRMSRQVAVIRGVVAGLQRMSVTGAYDVIDYSCDYIGTNMDISELTTISRVASQMSLSITSLVVPTSDSYTIGSDNGNTYIDANLAINMNAIRSFLYN